MSPKVTQARIDARRQQIFDAACAVFIRKSVRNTTIRDICAEAGLSTGAMYNYFAGKREIILAMAELSRRRNAGILAGEGGAGRTWTEIVDGLTGYFITMLDSLDRESPQGLSEVSRLDLELWSETVSDEDLRQAMRSSGAAMMDPLTAAAASWFTVSAAIAIPGMIVAILAAWWRFDLDLTISPPIVPAVGLVLLTGTIIGFAMAHAIPNPMVTLLITQVLIFFILGFSPISFPVEQLPGWLGSAHQALSFAHMANIVRDGLTDGLTTDAGTSYVILGLWAIGAVIVAALTLGRRG